VLSATALRRAYRGANGQPIEVLRGVDLTLARGEQVVVVGRSGSGKSTLLNLLGCLDRVDSGELSFDGRALTGASRRALARFRGESVGFVFQAFHLIPSLTAWENVMLATRYVGHDRAAAAAVAEGLFARLGVAERKGHYPGMLSGGEQQRVAFCRAVLNDPPLILADEPTGNLDRENTDVLLEELRVRARSGRSAVLIVTHDPELVTTADRTLVLADGRLTPSG
jgi:ABC-type lipoprotein export system ATPase subunit